MGEGEVHLPLGEEGVEQVRLEPAGVEEGAVVP